MAVMAWDESLHPRNEHGEWTFSHFGKIDLPRSAAVDKFAEGVDKVLRGSGVKVDVLRIMPRKGASAGAYARFKMERTKGTTTTSLELRAGLAKSDSAIRSQSKREREVFAAKRANELARTRSNAADMTRPGEARAFAARRLEILDATTRWSVGSEAADPMVATGAHEAAHALWHGNDAVRKSFQTSFLTIPPVDRAKVSDYAYVSATSSELFAEAMAMRVTGGTLPQSVSDALDAALAAMKP